MNAPRLPSIGIVFAQFAAYHVDRCEAVAARLAGRFSVRAVEVATTSATYAWEASGEVAGCEKLTLFPGRRFEETGWFERLRAELRVLRQCRYVLIGLAYSERDVIALSWLLRLMGTRVVVLSESKFDDQPRSWWREGGKALLMLAYHAAIVGGRRHVEYFRFLGFGRRRVTTGYDTVGTDRIRSQAASLGLPPAHWEDRPFIFVGRFVAKKNLATLLRAHAAYAAACGGQPRRLVMAGDGPLRGELQALAAELGIADFVEWPGFLPAHEVSARLSGALALCLVSVEEQWGLVVNEALALSLPVIVSEAVGARDTLVRAGRNGFVVDPGDVDQMAGALLELSSNQELWERMSASSAARASLGDTDRLADAVEALCDEARVKLPATSHSGRSAREKVTGA